MKTSRRKFGLVALFLAVSCLFCLCPVRAQDREFSAMGGIILNDASHKTGAWQLDFSQSINDVFRFSVFYLNEGNLYDHHRDGLAAQLWAETKFDRFRLGAGIGPYLIFFDTRADDSIDRGIGGVASLDGKYFVTDNWFLTMRYNYVVASRMNTHMWFGGLGYNFDAANQKPAVKKKWQPDTKNEIALYAGDGIMNNHSGSGFAGMIEYRRNLSKHFDVTAAYINETKERQGGAVQLWAVQRFFDDRLSLGIGAGGYEAYNKHPSGFTTNGIISGGLGLRVYENWEARLDFSRVIAPHDRDADLIMAGLGLKF